MTFPDLLAELDKRRVTIAAGPGDTLVIEGPPRSIDDLAAELADHKVLLRWTAAAATTGHTWRACDACRQFRLAAGNHPRNCNLTPRCTGHLLPVRPPNNPHPRQQKPEVNTDV